MEELAITGVVGCWAFWDIFLEPWFWCGFGGWIVASVIKIIVTAAKTREIDFERLISTGGMPSSHSATVSGLAFGIGYTEGFGTPIATLAVAFAIITMFDAATVRKAAGEHAKILNAMLKDIKEKDFKPQKRLRELLGHTRPEVYCGMATGILWAALVCWLWR